MRPRRIVGRLTLTGQRGGWDPTSPIMQSVRNRASPVSLEVAVLDDGTLAMPDAALAKVCLFGVADFARAADTLGAHPIHAADERGQRVTLRPLAWLEELLRDGTDQPGRALLGPLRALPVPIPARTMAATSPRTR